MLECLLLIIPPVQQTAECHKSQIPRWFTLFLSSVILSRNCWTSELKASDHHAKGMCGLLLYSFPLGLHIPLRLILLHLDSKLKLTLYFLFLFLAADGLTLLRHGDSTFCSRCGETTERYRFLSRTKCALTRLAITFPMEIGKLLIMEPSNYRISTDFCDSMPVILILDNPGWMLDFKLG